MVEASGKKEMKWYLRPVMVLVAILAVGPLAIPLVWLSPAFKKWVKIIITIVLVMLTIWFVKASSDLYQTLLKDMQLIQDVLKAR